MNQIFFTKAIKYVITHENNALRRRDIILFRIFSIAIIALSLGVASCSKGPGPALANSDAVYDSYEDWNRSIFAFNNVVDEYALSPVASAYDTVTPSVLRLIIGNELDYIQSPISIINALLQGNYEVFRHVTARFLLNTTFGGLGLLDPARDFGFAPHYEDFGQTLAVWGVKSGRYYMTPFLGPLTLRDVGGKIVDYGFDPLTYVSGSNMTTLEASKFGLNIIEFRARNFDTIEALKSSTEDYYAAVRSIYIQKRNSDIQNTNLKSKDEFIDFNTYQNDDIK